MGTRRSQFPYGVILRLRSPNVAPHGMLDMTFPEGREVISVSIYDQVFLEVLSARKKILAAYINPADLVMIAAVAKGPSPQ